MPTKTFKVKEWRKIYPANPTQKKAKIARLISDEADYRIRKIIKDKKRHYIMIKDSIFQEVIQSILNEYAPKWNINIDQAKTDKIEKINIKIHYDSQRLQHSFFSN